MNLPELQPLPVRIVLASVLKPVTDPRLLARLGRTLAELPGAEVHIVAHVAADCPAPRPDTQRPNVFLHPLFDFPRLSLARALVGRTLDKILRNLQPDVLVVGAAELLAAGLRWHRRTGRPLVYDVRENYALNVRTQGIFPPLVAPALAARIERLEAAAAPHLAGALLAERVYAEQLPWLAACRRVEIMENKYQPPTPLPTSPLRKPLTPDRPVRLLLSGTLSELYGTFDAIEAAREAIIANGLRPELWLVGHAPQAADARRLRALAAQYSWLHLTGIEAPVPHTVIVDAIRRADAGLLPYRPHPSLAGCIPTKLWEYLGEGLPTLQRRAGGWCQVQLPPLPQLPQPSAISSCGQGRVTAIMCTAEASPSELTTALTMLLNAPPPAAPPAGAFWTTEAPRLLAFFGALSAA